MIDKQWQKMPNVDYKILLLMLRTKGVDCKQIAEACGYHENSIYAYTSGKEARKPHVDVARIIWNYAVEHLSSAQINAAIIQ